MKNVTPYSAVGFISASLLALSFAGLSAAHWIISLEGQSTEAVALAVIASVCVSLLGFSLAYMSRTYGLLLLLPALVFVGADTYQNALGYQTVKALTVSGEVDAAQARLDQARADLAALPLPDATGAIRKASTWETVNNTLTERVRDAERDMEALTTPDAKTEHVLAAMALLQLALCIAFAGLGKRKDEPEAVTEAVQPDMTNVTPIRKPVEMDARDARVWAKLTGS